jgi:ubiquinone/menaquinone biosynthesis C-methylase UbiE
MISPSYIHGVGDRKTEQDRLKLQASLMAQHLWRGIDLSSLTSSKPFLELGCGVAAQTPDLLDHLPLGSKVIGIDHDPYQITKAFENMKHHRHWEKSYDFYQMDGTNLEFETGYFKGAYVCWVLEHMTEDQVSKTLSELKRVVEKNGLILINETDATPLSSVRFTTPDGDDFPPKTLMFFQAMLRLQQEGGGNGSFGVEETMCRALQTAGFKDYRYKRIVIDTTYPDPMRSALNIGTLRLLESTLPALMEKNWITQEEFNDVCQEITLSPLFHWEGGQISIQNS